MYTVQDVSKYGVFIRLYLDTFIQWYSFVKVFQPILITVTLCIWVENNRETIESNVLGQWQNKTKLSLRKMYLTLSKQKCDSSESSLDFFLALLFHLLCSEFH